MTRTTKAERDALAADIDQRTTEVHVELDALLYPGVPADERIERLDTVNGKLAQLTEDISYLQRITKESRSWG